MERAEELIRRGEYLSADVALSQATYELCIAGVDSDRDAAQDCLEQIRRKRLEIAAPTQWQRASGKAPDCRLGQGVAWNRLDAAAATLAELESLTKVRDFAERARAELDRERERYELCVFRKSCALAASACEPALLELRKARPGSGSLAEAERLFAHFSKLGHRTKSFITQARAIYDVRWQLGGVSDEHVPAEQRSLDEQLGYRPLPHACGTAAANDLDHLRATRDPHIAAELRKAWDEVMAAIGDPDRVGALNESWFQMTLHAAYAATWPGLVEKSPVRDARSRGARPWFSLEVLGPSDSSRWHSLRPSDPEVMYIEESSGMTADGRRIESAIAMTRAAVDRFVARARAAGFEVRVYGER